MSLHLVFSRQGLASCLPRRHSEDPIVLFGDGIYALLENDIECLLLLEDAIARGISINSNTARAIDYAELVKLTLNHTPIVSWAD
tara:strand:- start:1136 stop:1390 length:255 start_codon:yes stop_codon:yes gene_type:complete